MTSKRSAKRSKGKTQAKEADVSDATWTTRDGRTLLLSEMDDRHLLNTFRYLERRLEEEQDMEDAIAQEQDDAWRAAGLQVDDFKLRLKEFTTEIERRALDLKHWCVTCQTFHAEKQRGCVMTKCACGRAHPAPINDLHRKALGCSASS